MSLKKSPFISAVTIAPIDGRTVVPTQIYYDSNRKAYIGYDARERCDTPELLFENFKIELGEHNPDDVTKKTVRLPNAPRNTVAGIAQDFFRALLGKVDQWLEVQGRARPKSILIAEPLSLGGTNMHRESWLSNYRRAILRVLEGQFDKIDFLPEPFAVFQYYRYGVRHPLIAEQRKHVALVLDFGGGTFDISVIETTKSGDVSQSGKNSKPLSANSEQVGGFLINRMLAADLLMSVVNKSVRSDVRKSLERSDRIKTPEDVAELPERQQIFFRHYRRLLQTVEVAKITICNSIANWNLEADLSGVASYPLSVPTDPYSTETRMATSKLDAGQLRRLFEDRIWKPKLREAIRTTIARASQALKGQDISIVLLSGGSSNMRWLAKLVARDIAPSHLPAADVLELSESFQEIVSKGLATECARRFYTEGEGDFRAVTYNRLCLATRSDSGELEIRRARPMTPELAPGASSEVDDGVLLPSASSLNGLVDKPLVWKVRLSSPPRRQLEYYFMRSSFDPEDLEARHNIVDFRAQTPKDTRFQAAIEVELTVREDGTATPRFIYGRHDQSPGTVAGGKPFHIDMTYASSQVGSSTYLGFDFGTSSSAVSFVDSVDVQMFQERSRSPGWRELSDLLSELPYPAAFPLARFISELDAEKRDQKGRDAAEALLTLAAYVSYMDGCATGVSSAMFKGFAHRSAGPLWGMIKQRLGRGAGKLNFAGPLDGLVRPENAELIDRWIAELNSVKHGRRPNVDWVSFLGLLANHMSRLFDHYRLGVFENVVAKRFATGVHKGIFRALHGTSSTFVDVLDYEGPHPFSDELVYLLDPGQGRALCLSPLYLWGLQRDPSDPTTVDLHEYDDDKRNAYLFKSTQPSEGFLVRANEEWAELYAQIAAMRTSDPSLEVVSGLVLTSHDDR